MEKTNANDSRAMLNAYPDSIGGSLKDIVTFLSKDEVKGAFGSFYILPSVFNTDLDRGFSVIDYDINEELASRDDIERLKSLGIDLKLDFILNHSSVLSKQFQDLLKNGEDSKYRDFFINWNEFWKGCGEMTEEGYIRPDDKYIENMFFRKPGLPILMVRFPDGRDVPYWNTFYQEVIYKRPSAQDLMHELPEKLQYLTAVRLSEVICRELDNKKAPKDFELGKYEKYRASVTEYLEANRRYLGQMDVNIKSPLVWEHYENTIKTLAGYGARIVRLDAFAYGPKEPGEKNFLNDPGTWELLAKVRELADKYGVTLLPEIHASYGEGIYQTVADKGYMTYDFFLPGLLIYALEKKDGSVLKRWADEITEKKIRTVNMLGCHDGIPLLDLKGFLSDDDIDGLIDTLVSRGGLVKNLHGQKKMYYQVNATYFSALGEDERKMELARAIQLFMPGKPQIWYLDLFAGKNDHEAVKRAGEGGHKEINRTNLSLEDAERALERDIFKKQLELLKLRNTHPAFGFDSDFEMICEGSRIKMTFKKNNDTITLDADLDDYSYRII